jgi:AraC family transcriptional regulator, positive regulator of tynA and feaB
MADRLPGRVPVSAHDNISSLAQWKDYVREHFPWLEISGGSRLKGFGAEVNSLSLGTSALATIRSSETEVHRTRQLAERADAGYVKLMWQLSGSMEIELRGKPPCAIQDGLTASPSWRTQSSPC